MDFTSLLLFSGALIFLMIIGPMRKQKKEKNFITQLKRGDRVITKSGLHGKIIEIVEGSDSCVLETMAGKIRYEVSAISFEMSAKLNTKLTKK
ncbi:preprotein translocase subunit YajC [Flavobacteriaceae bacterium]|jgi:preprotein translocase subunit YajC|nr:preprotein translocase subunit YajC [Flavobacteriaceae bacterium]MDB0043566.1 preprotein translocase subunit YajC [Flavobacteriaceae bacterium]MDB4086667.1 preprotein translocase subunit YajC [Flavobacteriaceae bacterium]MDB4240312.1 preprotein translocase subunit YajC [Flavobacteriaceae bacterium]MDB9787765.1 preprotein translocase subunit YajC [Flavobacteriaceae bacterium]